MLQIRCIHVIAVTTVHLLVLTGEPVTCGHNTYTGRQLLLMLLLPWSYFVAIPIPSSRTMAAAFVARCQIISIQIITNRSSGGYNEKKARGMKKEN
jgi:hypothetical protein